MWEGLLAGPLPLCLRDSSLAVQSIVLDVMATVGDDTLKQLSVRTTILFVHPFGQQPITNIIRLTHACLIWYANLICLIIVTLYMLLVVTFLHQSCGLFCGVLPTTQANVC